MPWLFLLLLLAASPARADTITWKAASQILSVSDPRNFWPGLTAGTPWELTVSFDSNAPPTVISPGCNSYSAGPTTFVLGGFTYTRSTGSIFTNAALPEIGCIGSLPEGEAGLVQFFWGPGWTQEPGAWDVNLFGGIMLAGYYDLLVTDGSLPTVPTFDPSQGPFGGLEYENRGLDTSFFGGAVRFEAVQTLTPIPEPGTIALLGSGLVAVALRRRRGH